MNHDPPRRMGGLRPLFCSPTQPRATRTGGSRPPLAGVVFFLVLLLSSHSRVEAQQPAIRTEAKPEPGRVEGLSTVQDYLRVAFQTFRFTLTITDVYDVEPDFLIAEYTSTGEILPTGKPYANAYVGLWRFRDGRASFTREYYDPMAAL